jgi:diguanylate cyclase (GGDEF)-like protein/PAS domain S-box-containing protein
MKSTLNILICLFLLNSGIAFSAPLEKVSLQLKWFHAFQFAGYYAAKEKGFYAAEGLDVDINELIKHIDNVGQVLKGESNYGVADSNLLLDRLNRKPVVVLASIFQHSALVYVSLKSSGIVSPYEIKGKRVMEELNVTSSVDAPLQAMLYETGITRQDYTHINHSYDYGALINGDTDVMPAYLTDVGHYFREKHVDINIIDPRNYGIDFLGDNLFTTEQEISQHPERVQRFLRASLKGWNYALKHPEEIVQLILRNYNAKQRLSADFLRAEAVETAKMILPDSIPLGSSSLKRFQRMAEIYQQLGLVQSLDGLKGFVYQQELTTSLNLSQEEKNWLQTHPVIRLAIDKDFAPYEWIDSAGNYVGLTADYIHKVEQRLGIKFAIEKDKPWAETLAMAKRGEVDVVSDANQTPEREQYLNFTDPHVSIPVVIINEEAAGFIGNLQHLNGKRVAVEQSYFMQERLSNDYPEIQIVAAKNTEDALAMVNSGAVDAYVGDAASVNYIIKKTGMINLRFSGDTGYKSEHRMAATKKYPILISLLTKALNSISSSERQEIETHWMNLQIKHDVTAKTLIKYGGAAVFVLFLIVVRNMSLRREIKQRKQMAVALQKSEHRYRQLFDSLVSGFALHEIICDNSGKPVDYRFLEVNSAFLNMTGLKAENVIGHTLLEIYPNSELFWIQRYGHVALTGEATHFTEYSHAIKKYFEITAYSPQHGQFAVTFQDVTERQLAEIKLRIAATVFESHEGMMITDVQSVILNVNHAFTLITGYDKEEVLGKTPRILSSGRHDKNFYQQLWQTVHSTGSWQGEIWDRRKNGEVYPQWMTITAVKSNDNQTVSHYVATLMDITERKITEDRINQLAFYDPLTQLPNRRLLHDRLRHGIEVSHRTGNSLAVLMLDLDGFKAVNDSFGHAAGDELLQQVAERIKFHLREMDTVARLGGDEFIVLLENIIQHEQSAHVANTIIDTLKQPFDLSKNRKIQIGTSIGIALYPQHGIDMEKLLDNADTALYHAKSSGRGCFAYFSEVTSTQEL